MTSRKHKSPDEGGTVQYCSLFKIVCGMDIILRSMSEMA
jgi:hypothetical protein